MLDTPMVVPYTFAIAHSPQLPQHIFLGENIQEGNFLSNFVNFGRGLGYTIRPLHSVRDDS